MDWTEFENMGYWEKQVACSKLWGELTTPIYSVKDSKGRTPPQARLRRTSWEGQWLYTDGDAYEVLADEEVKRWMLVASP